MKINNIALKTLIIISIITVFIILGVILYKNYWSPGYDALKLIIKEIKSK